MRKRYWPWLAGMFLLGACAGPAAAAEANGVKVEVIAPGGSALDLRAEIFHYYGKPEEPLTAVFFSPEEFKVSAGNMKYDRREEVIFAGGGVLLSGEEIELQAEELNLYLNREEFAAGGGVVLTAGELKLTGWLLEGEISGGPLTATGEVEWSFREFQGSAGKLVYRHDEEKVYLSGNPVVCWEQGYMEGIEMILSLKTGEVTVTGPARSKLQP